MLRGKRAVRKNVVAGNSNKSQNRTRRPALLLVASAASALLMGRSTDAANGTWSATSAGNWTATGSWSGGTVPGATVAITGTNANGDVATFNTATAGNAIIDSTSENIKSITFDTALINGYTIGSTSGNSLYLSSGGTAQIASTLSANGSTYSINSPLVIEGNSGLYTFANNKVLAGIALVLGGPLSGGASGNTVVTFNGSSTPTNNFENGVISNGSATTLGVTQSAANWTYSGNNTYTGTTLITGGTAYFTGSNTIGAIVLGNYGAGGGTLDLSGANGSFSNSSSINVYSGATFKYDNYSASNSNRVASTINLDGGTFSYVAANGSNTTQTIAGISLNPAQTSFLSTSATSSGNTSALTITNLTVGSHATLQAALANANTVAGQVSAGSITSASLINGVLPWAVESTNASFLTLDSTNTYVGAYGSINGTYTTTFGSNTATQNVKLTTAPSTLAANDSLNALNYAFGGNLNLGGFQLTVTSGGMILNNASATVTNGTITTGTGNQELYIHSLTAATLGAVIADNGSPVAFTKAGTGTLTINSVNTYTGATSIDYGTVLLNTGASLSASSAVSVATGATLNISSGATVGGNVTVYPSTGILAAAGSNPNLYNSGTISGQLWVKPAYSNAPVLVSGNSAVTGNAVLLGGSTTGSVLVDGGLTINGSTGLTVGTISSTSTGSAGLGAIFFNNTNATGTNLNFSNGTSLQRFAPGSGAIASLNSTGTVNLFSFGQSDNIPYNVSIGSGTWNIGQAGQNNSGAQSGGTLTIASGATVNLGNSVWTTGGGGGYMHGIYNVNGTFNITSSSASSVSEGNGRSTAPTAGATNGLQFNVGNGGNFSVTASAGLSLGTASAQAAGVNTTNSLSVAAGGLASCIYAINLGDNLSQGATETNSVNIAGTLNASGASVVIGNGGTASTNQSNSFTVTGTATTTSITLGNANNAASNSVSNTLTLSSGSLTSLGTITAATGTNQTNAFAWTGGTLGARTITPSSGFTSGAINATGLLQPASTTLSPGGSGFTGLTTINGNYNFSSGATLSLDIAGATASSSAQDANPSTKFDSLQINGSSAVATLTNGTLNLNVIGSSLTVPTTLTIINGTGGGTITGAFANATTPGTVYTSPNGQTLFTPAYYNSGSTAVTIIAYGDGWNSSSGGLWPTGSNWTAGSAPAANGAALFGTALTTSGNINLNGASQSVGVINFYNSAASYNITGGTLVLNASSGTTATINDILGNHIISAPIAFGGSTTNLTTNVNTSGNTLTLSGGLSVAGTFNASGAGTTFVSQPAGTYIIGTLTVPSGDTLKLGGVAGAFTTISGNGSFGANTQGAKLVFNGGNWNLPNGNPVTYSLEIDGGTVNTVGSNDFAFDQPNQTLLITGGALNGSSNFGIRLGNRYGANNSNSPSSISAVQSGGTVTVTGTAIELGNPVGGTTDSYTLTAGTLSQTNVGYGLNIGADTAGTGTSTFNLGGTGNLVIAGKIAGSQGAGAKQVFNFSGGTLSATNIDTTNLQAVAGGAYGTLVDNGGTISPGGPGVVGPTNITGGLQLNGTSSTLALDVIGNTADILNVSGAVSVTGTPTLDLNITGSQTASPIVLANFSSGSLAASNFTETGSAVPHGYTLQFNPTNIELVLLPTGPATLTWNNAGGAGTGLTWDTTSINWNNGSGVVAYSDNSNTSTGDIVTFNDTNNGNYDVTLNSTVHPTSVTFNTANASGYSLHGTGGIAGNTPLTLTGPGTVTISTTNTYTGGTNAANGTLVLASAGAFPSATPLTIASGATVQLANHAANATIVPVVSSLSNAGTIDLVNNAMVLQNSSGSLSTITSEVAAGFNGGNWNGTGNVITSSLAAADTTHLTAVGIATGLTSFEGLSVNPSDVLLKYTYYGDALLTGSVTTADYAKIDAGYLGNLTGWQNGDFNYDGSVNGSDYTLIDNAFNTQGAQLAAEIASPTAQLAGGVASAVPEPASLGLIGFAAMGLLGRRNRRRN